MVDDGGTEGLAEPAASWPSPSSETVAFGGLSDDTRPMEDALTAMVSAGAGNARAEAYFSRREKPQSQQRLTCTEAHWNKRPAAAAQIHPVECFQFQALACRATPQPTDGSQARWPENSMVEPLDDRRHPHWFGYRQQRWKGHWAPAFSAKGLQKEECTTRLTVEDVVLLLTARHGNLKAGFDKLDFFKDDKLSGLEWQEGLQNLIATGKGPAFDRCKGLLENRSEFNRNAQQLFRSVCKAGDGFLTFEQLSAPPRELAESSPKRPVNRKLETGVKAIIATTPVATTVTDDSSSAFGWTAPSKGASRGMQVKISESSELCRAFASLLMDKFPNVDKAFSSMDHNKNGQLSAAEFVEGARNVVRFAGDALKVFKELDTQSNEYITRQDFRYLRAVPEPEAELETMTLQTQKEMTSARRQRSCIKNPASFTRGACFASSHISLPLGERVTSAAGFYTLSRSPTGRLDDLVHPNESPGVDRENFNSHHGPGTYEKRPGHFAEIGCLNHPLRGDSWKVGGNWNGVARFGSMTPSVQGKQDEEYSAKGFAAHTGRRPEGPGGSTVIGLGAVGPSLRSGRLGKTFGTDSSFGVIGPKPIGSWSDSRLTLHLKSRSEPTLLNLNV